MSEPKFYGLDGRLADGRELTAENLHELHVSLSEGSGVSFDVGPARWRPEGRTASREVLRAMAYRLVFCWNMNEGVRTEKLEDGVVARFYDLALELAEAAKGRKGRLGELAAKVLACYDEFEVELGAAAKCPCAHRTADA